MTTYSYETTGQKIFLVVLSLLISQLARDTSRAETPQAIPQADRKMICTEMEHVLDTELKSWYPLCIDTVYGGYYSDINSRWELEGRQEKMIVTQARHVWSTAMPRCSIRRTTSFVR